MRKILAWAMVVAGSLAFFYIAYLGFGVYKILRDAQMMQWARDNAVGLFGVIVFFVIAPSTLLYLGTKSLLRLRNKE